MSCDKMHVIVILCIHKTSHRLKNELPLLFFSLRKKIFSHNAISHCYVGMSVRHVVRRL